MGLKTDGLHDFSPHHQDNPYPRDAMMLLLSISRALALFPQEPGFPA